MRSKPPYTITKKAADYIAKIVETVTRLEYGTAFKRNTRLHRENRLRTIHSSLAIEDSRNANDSGAFIEFTLSSILDTIASQTKHQVEHQVEHQVDFDRLQIAQDGRI